MDHAVDHPDQELMLRGRPLDPATLLANTVGPEPTRPIILEPAAGLTGYW